MKFKLRLPGDGGVTGCEANSEWSFVSRLSIVEDMEYENEYLGYGSDCSSLVDKVADELQFVELPWEQPLLGPANVWNNMSNNDCLDEVQLGQPEALEPRGQLDLGQAKVHSVSKSSG